MKKLIILLLLVVSLGLSSCDIANDHIIIDRSERLLMEGTPYETTLYSFDTNIEGPVIVIIGGIHGVERAGWMTAEILLDFAFQKGVIHILPRASTTAVASLSRFTNEIDLNRQFPGDENGNEVEQLAYVIFQTLLELEPDVVLDLHEARTSVYTHATGLGDSVITSHSASMLFLIDVLEQFNALEAMQGRLMFTNLYPAPEGSINREFTRATNVPVFTTETNRGGGTSISIEGETIPIEDRVAQKTLLVKLFLSYIWSLET